jgi:phage regulator Rha-like protein
MNKFDPLVVIVGGEPLASSETIAKGMKQQHASTIKLVRKHQAALDSLGQVRFQIRLNRQGSKTEFAMLNEQQAAILISLMRNTERVVDFKIALVAEFYRMRDALNQRTQNLWQQLQAQIAKEVQSEVRASFGSRLMLERKAEITGLRKERGRLEAEIQPSLMFH